MAFPAHEEWMGAASAINVYRILSDSRRLPEAGKLAFDFKLPRVSQDDVPPQAYE
jgi:hypothetical protein